MIKLLLVEDDSTFSYIIKMNYRKLLVAMK